MLYSFFSAFALSTTAAAPERSLQSCCPPPEGTYTADYWGVDVRIVTKGDDKFDFKASSLFEDIICKNEDFDQDCEKLQISKNGCTISELKDSGLRVTKIEYDCDKDEIDIKYKAIGMGFKLTLKK